MIRHGKSLVAVTFGFVVALVAIFPLAALREAGAAEAKASGEALQPHRILLDLRPDYGLYIHAMRPVTPTRAATRSRRIYMALVRPGAEDPGSDASAPLAGPGSRNDILYERNSITGERSKAWTQLLLDHEYFHARHLAGATALPLPGGVTPEMERHFFEAAAWGFNVSEARTSRYPGLRADEFREALNRYGEHYAALRTLMRGGRLEAWERFSDLLRNPERFLRTSDPSSRATLAHPSGPGRSGGTHPENGEPSRAVVSPGRQAPGR